MRLPGLPRSALRWIRIALALAILVYLARKIGHTAPLERFTAARPGFIALAVLLVIIDGMTRAWNWAQLIRAMHIAPRVRYSTVLGIHWGGAFLGQVVPSTVGTDALRAMVHGSLSGLFDGPTTVALDFTAPIQTVDLSRLDGRGDETIAMTLACVSSWGQSAIDDPAGPVRLVVRDELWRAMRIPAMVRKLDGDLRLSRATGTIQVLATHRLADFETVGAVGSPEAAIAANLVASCDVRVCLAQDVAPLAMTRDAMIFAVSTEQARDNGSVDSGKSSVVVAAIALNAALQASHSDQLSSSELKLFLEWLHRISNSSTS